MTLGQKAPHGKLHGPFVGVQHGPHRSTTVPKRVPSSSASAGDKDPGDSDGRFSDSSSVVTGFSSLLDGAALLALAKA